MKNEVPCGCWMSAEFLKGQFGVTDFSQLRHDPAGWGGKPRYCLDYGVTLDRVTVPDYVNPSARHNVRRRKPVTVKRCQTCPMCDKVLTGKEKTCSPKCRKKLSRLMIVFADVLH